MSKKERLFDQFPPVSTKEWMDKIHADLKGADFNKRLVWKTDEGFDIMPFYRMEDIDNLRYIDTLPGEFPYLRGSRIKDNNWLVRQNIKVTDYSEANRKALTILMKGVDSIGFVISDPESVNEENFNILLHDIHIEAVEINFLCSGKAIEILDNIINIVQRRGLDPLSIKGAVEADPLGRLMRNGKLCVTPEEGFDYLALLTEKSSVLPYVCTVHLNASDFGNGGGGIVQEIAYGLAMGSEYLAQLTERGLNTKDVASKIRFSFSIGSEYFPEIAKLRAARLLWAVITSGFERNAGESAKMNIHSVTGKWNKTVYDPYVNLLRTQTEVMSASLGGADSITVEPFDIAFRQPDEFSERIARNQQLILKEESYFDKVADPSAGSYYIENLTSLLSESIWKLFCEIEEMGGFLASLKSGFIQKKLFESAERAKKDVSKRKRILLGTNQYPNTQEEISGTIDINKLFSRKPDESDLMVDPVLLWRGSEECEQIRIAVDKSAKRPVVILLPMGSVVMRKARSQFITSFFGCGGYHIIDNNGFEDVEDAVKAALEAKADIAVVCSSDEEYPVFAPEINERLKDKLIVVVAGNPPSADELRSKGVDTFVHIRSDIAETLKFFNGKLGISL